MNFALLFLAVLTNSISSGIPQAVSPVAQPESVQDLISRLTPPQKEVYDQAVKAFSTQHYPDALANFKKLLEQLPGDSILSKYAGEASVDSGDAAFATVLLKPIAAASPNDWQAAALLSRACAESGDVACRDSGVAHMKELRRQGVTPTNMLHYVLERISLGENTMLLRTSLEPWGPYKVYQLAQVLDKNNQIFLRITLESSDADQPQFAKEHPAEAALGTRRFSIDAYRETGRNSSGQRTQAHFTFKMIDGEPSYATVRDEFIKIAKGEEKPISSRTGLIVQ